MSKEGSLARIEKYKRYNQTELLAEEEDFYKKTYAEKIKPVETSKKSK